MLVPHRPRYKFLPGLAVVGPLLLSGVWIWNADFAPDAQAAPSGKSASPAAKPVPAAKPPVWKAASATQRAGASQAIRAQLEHFKRGKWEKAVGYQSSNLKRNFPSTAAFRQMMEVSYPQFTKYKKIEFGEARAAGSRVQMAIKLTGRDNIVVRAVYLMVREKGGYKVEGVSGGFAPRLPEGDLA